MKNKKRVKLMCVLIYVTMLIKPIMLTVESSNYECNGYYDNLKINFMFLERESVFLSLPQPSMLKLRCNEEIRKNLELIENVIVLNYKNTNDAIFIFQDFISYLQDINVTNVTIHANSNDKLENIKNILHFCNRLVRSLGECNLILCRLNDLSQDYDMGSNADSNSDEPFGIGDFDDNVDIKPGNYAFDSLFYQIIHLLNCLKDFCLYNIQEYDKIIKIWKQESQKVFDLAMVERKYIEMQDELQRYELKHKSADESREFWEDLNIEQKLNKLQPFYYQNNEKIILDFMKMKDRTKVVEKEIEEKKF